jgi:NADPH:quinone reductase-like Zn-dependent oxidoreductase
VIAAVSAKHAAEAKRLGADEVVEVGPAPLRLEDAVRGVDAVIDAVGGDAQRGLFAVLKPGGILVSAVAEPDAAEAERRRVRAKFIMVDVTAARLTELARMVEAGELRTHVAALLPLADAARAHEMLDGTRERPGGKIVLDVAG